ncbi:MAG: FG-GAP-like repeat-containing protein, partial [Bacteroidales bacterium]
MRLHFLPAPVVLLILLLSLPLSCNRSGSRQERNGERQQEMTEQALSARTKGLAFLEENKLEDAEQEFLTLVRLAPDEAIGYANLGLVYLRMGRYEESEQQLKKALEKTPEDADIRLNLATVYQYMNRDSDFLKELEKGLKDQPDHLQTLYRLAEYYGRRDDAESLAKREHYLKRAVEVAPANIVPRLHLVENQIVLGNRDEAINQLEEVKRIFPEFSGEADEHYRNALASLRSNRMDEALTQAMIFHNFLKLTNPYNQGISDLQGFQGSSVGKPMFTFSQATSLFIPEGASILEALRFTDVTALAGLDRFGGDAVEHQDPAKASATHISTGDFNHDGVEDLYLGTYLPGGAAYRHFMLQAELGMFTDVTAGTGLQPCGEESSARFADYDNDGWFDLLLLCEGKPVLYHSVSEEKYVNVTRDAFPDENPGAVNALILDMDHEGDLDLFFSTESYNRLYRNNSDGTFTDFTEESGLAGSPGGSYESCFGDFDDDGDLDLFTVNRDAPCQLFSNLREGRFREVGGASGLDNLTGKQMVAAGDYNNDGYLDLFVAGSAPGSFAWYRNEGRGMFEPDDMPGLLSNLPDQFNAYDACFFDFDNDGHLDLLIVGDPGDADVPGGILLHNTREGKFEDVSHLLPGDFEGGRQIAVADYNDDGDLDIFLAGLNGGARLLRNDGGNANRYLKMRLVGVRSGSGKNNYYGIGAKVELRAGNLYQMKVVTEPNIYFGLADRSDVDVVRILWTNGTPQNIFDPGIEQALIEEQQLKGSCPFLYTWDGDAYVFVKDIMWSSALGMPMGIMGEGQTYGFP